MVHRILTRAEFVAFIQAGEQTAAPSSESYRLWDFRRPDRSAVIRPELAPGHRIRSSGEGRPAVRGRVPLLRRRGVGLSSSQHPISRETIVFIVVRHDITNQKGFFGAAEAVTKGVPQGIKVLQFANSHAI